MSGEKYKTDLLWWFRSGILDRNYSDGAYSQARLWAKSSNYASVEKQYKGNIIYTPQNSTSYFFNFNLNP